MHVKCLFQKRGVKVVKTKSISKDCENKNTVMRGVVKNKRKKKYIYIA